MFDEGPCQRKPTFDLQEESWSGDASIGKRFPDGCTWHACCCCSLERFAVEFDGARYLMLNEGRSVRCFIFLTSAWKRIAFVCMWLS